MVSGGIRAFKLGDTHLLGVEFADVGFAFVEEAGGGRSGDCEGGGRGHYLVGR